MIRQRPRASLRTTSGPLSVLIAALACTRAAVTRADTPASKDPRVASADNARLLLICGADLKRVFTAKDKEKARFVLDAAGGLTVNDSAPKGTFSFTTNSPSIAIVRGVRKDEREPQILACGTVDSGARYEWGLKDATLASMQLFSRVDDQSLLDERREKVLAEGRRVEREAVHSVDALRRFVAAVRMVHVSPGPHVISAAQAAGGHLAATLATMRGDFRCEQTSYFEADICDEIQDLEVLTASINATLDELLKKDSDQRLALLRAHGTADTLQAMAPRPELTVGAQKTHCENVSRLAWLNDASFDRARARATVPIADKVFVQPYSAELGEHADVSTCESVGVVVVSVPAGDATSFGVHRGARLTLELATLIKTFVGAALPRVPGAGFLPKRAIHTATCDPFCGELMDMPKVQIPSLICERDGSLRFDDAAPLASGTDSRAHVLKRLDRNHTVDVAMCRGDNCTGAEDDKAVKARVRLRPSRAGAWSLVVEVAGGAHCTRDGCDFESLSKPAFQPILGPAGPDQVFEMQQDTDPRDVISTSLLLGPRLGNRFFVGVGPTLFVGAGGGAFTQWNVRGGYELGDGVFFTAGLGLRWVDMPKDYEIGERISVPRGMSAPPLRTYGEVVPQFSLGLGVDLATLGAAATDVYRALGGK
jgi:hypothetical protein